MYAEHSWSEENLRAVVETPQRPKTTIADIPPAGEPLDLPHEPPEAAEDAKEEPTGEQEEDDEMQEGASGHERSTWNVELRQKRETHRDTRECVREETIDDEVTEAAGHTCSPPDDPVKRRLLKKTDLESSDARMAVEINDTDLLHTVNTLLNDETGEEEMPWSAEVQRMRILSILDDYEEMMKGRQEELNSLTENGSHDSCETV